MGACGCGDDREGFKLPGPGGLIYHLSFYPGCSYCHTGPGWLINRVPAEEEGDFEMRADPGLVFQSYGSTEDAGVSFAAIPVVDPEKLKPELRSVGLDEVDADEVPGAVREAAWKTYADWRARQRADQP